MRILDFQDGQSSATEPSQISTSSGKLVQYADDAAYVTAKGSAASAGDLYYNTTNDVIRYYDAGDSVWKTNEAQLNNATTSDPTVNDDSDDGYEVGSVWINATNSVIFTCSDATVGAAVWVESINLSASQAMSNKTLTSPVLNTAVSGTAVLDEDDMASDSATQICTQQSIKKFVEDQVAGGSSEMIRYDGHAGYGSTNTVIPYFTTSVRDTTSSIISFANSATDGFSITALVDCDVHITWHAYSNSVFLETGISLNSTQLTTAILSITSADRLAWQQNEDNSTGWMGHVHWSGQLEKDDVLRPHGDGDTTTAAGGLTVLVRA